MLNSDLIIIFVRTQVYPVMEKEKDMVVDENSFFREATLRICGNLDFEIALQKLSHLPEIVYTCIQDWRYVI